MPQVRTPVLMLAADFDRQCSVASVQRTCEVRRHIEWHDETDGSLGSVGIWGLWGSPFTAWTELVASAELGVFGLRVLRVDD